MEFPGSKIGTIDEVRGTIDTWMRYLPMGGRWRVLVIDEAQAMSPSAKEAFLEIVENARPNRMIIFTATRKQGKIPFSQALISRFKVFDFDAFDARAIKVMLDRISAGEGWPPVDPDGFGAIYAGSEGNMRKAVQLFETYQYTGRVLGEKLRAGPAAGPPVSGGPMANAVLRTFNDYRELYQDRSKFMTPRLEAETPWGYFQGVQVLQNHHGRRRRRGPARSAPRKDRTFEVRTRKEGRLAEFKYCRLVPQVGKTRSKSTQNGSKTG